jgi:hypothetical protein
MKAKQNRFRLRVLILGLIGFALFVLAYALANLALTSVFHSSSCNISLQSVRIAMVVTSPLNICESRGSLWKLITNSYLVGFLIFLAIVYSLSMGRKFKRCLSFCEVLIIAVASTYFLSFIQFLRGQNGAGTSIIGVDMMLYLLLGFAWELMTLAVEKKICKTGLSRLYLQYVFPLLLLGLLVYAIYFTGSDPWPHVFGVGVLLVYLSLKTGVLRASGHKPDKNKK